MFAWQRQNYLVGPNPFGLSRPPKWWLRELYRFDDQLVLIPGQKQRTFVLARRAVHSAGEPLHTVPGLAQHPDTAFLHEHQMVRVCEILPGVLWDMRVFHKLAAHDIRRLGGPTEVALELDRRDAKKAETIQADEDNELTARGADAWRSYATRTGARISLVKSQPRGPSTPHPVSVAVPNPLVSSLRRVAVAPTVVPGASFPPAQPS